MVKAGLLELVRAMAAGVNEPLKVTPMVAPAVAVLTAAEPRLALQSVATFRLVPPE